MPEKKERRGSEVYPHEITIHIATYYIIHPQALIRLVKPTYSFEVGNIAPGEHCQPVEQPEVMGSSRLSEILSGVRTENIVGRSEKMMHTALSDNRLTPGAAVKNPADEPPNEP